MKVANITTTEKMFFYHWVKVTYPLHRLGKTEGALLAELLYYRHKLSKEVNSEKLVNKLLFNYDTKWLISTNMKVSKGRLEVALTKLRKLKIVKGRTLNTTYAPGLNEGDKEFIFAYKFTIKDEEVKGHAKAEVYKDKKKNSI